MKRNDRWSQLSMKQRADLIKLYTDSGITSLDKIRKDYNSFAPEGTTETDGDVYAYRGNFLIKQK